MNVVYYEIIIDRFGRSLYQAGGKTYWSLKYLLAAHPGTKVMKK